MGGYALRRIAQAIPTLLGVSVAAFILSHLAPGDAAAEQCRRRSPEGRCTQEEVAQVRHQLGLDRSFPGQLAAWVGRTASGDLGISYSTGRPVTRELAMHLPATLELTVAAAVLSLAFAVPAGTVAAVRHRRPTDHLLRAVSLAGASMPSFWLALVLVAVFSVRLPVLPATGRGGLDHLVLPAVVLAVGPAAVLARFTRATVLRVLGSDHVRAASARGLRPLAVVVRHGLRNSLVPVVTAFGLALGHLLAGAAVVETIFVWPGLGQLAVDAITGRDYPVIQGLVLWTGAVFVALSLVIDLAYHRLDPRLRVGAGSGPQR